VPSLFTTTYAGTRGAIGETLNFVIPAGQMTGHLRLTARAAMGSFNAESTIDITVTLRQTLRLAGVMISYNGPSSTAPGAPNLSLAAPTLADLQNMSGSALTLFPVESTAAFRTAGSLVQSVPLQNTTFPTAGCGPAWDPLLARVVNARTADGNQPGWIYYGLLPSGTPMGPVGGCGGGGVAVGPINQPLTLAHEAGHAACFKHAPSGGAPNPDGAYPAYEPYDPAGTPQGSIGEYGLDVNNGSVASPATFRDIMGYANPKWISPYHYGRLVNGAVLNPVTVGMDQLWWRDRVREDIRRRARSAAGDRRRRRGGVGALGPVRGAAGPPRTATGHPQGQHPARLGRRRRDRRVLAALVARWPELAQRRHRAHRHHAPPRREWTAPWWPSR
jgi:hypothetical protein